MKGSNTVLLPDGAIKKVKCVGEVTLKRNIILKGVLYIPDFQYNLISVSKLAASANLSFLFDSSGCIMQDLSSKQTIGVGRMKKNLYLLQKSDIYEKESFCKALISENCLMISCKGSIENDFWHERLGHPSANVLCKMNISKNINRNDICEVCHSAKQTRLPFPLSSITTKAPFELLHVDIWGPYSVTSISGARYFLTIVDDFSRGVWTFLMQNKSQAVGILTSFLKYVQNQFDTRVKVVRIDNGSEFLSTSCQNLFIDNGIVHQRTCVYSPQQNGVVERKHRHLAQVARALLHHAGMPQRFWGEAILTATHLINKLPSQVLNWNCPYQVLNGKLPDYSRLKVFGSLCFATNLNPDRKKFDARARKCVFLGYVSNCKGYKLYDINARKIIVSRDVVFYESHLPFKTQAEKESELVPLPVIIEDAESPSQGYTSTSSARGNTFDADGGNEVDADNNDGPIADNTQESIATDHSNSDLVEPQ